MMWTKAGGRELPGLVKRRKHEKEMYEKDADNEE
jgi:GH24 family phage-related lysozyme (muramidase)